MSETLSLKRVSLEGVTITPDPAELPAPEADEPEQIEEQAPEVNDDAGEQGDEPETVIAFEDEDPDAAKEDDTPAIKQIRARLREVTAENKRLREASAPKPVEVGPKPTLESCEWDEDKFEQALDAWKETRRQSETQRTAAQQEDADRTAQWQRELAGYHEGKARLNLKDFGDAEAEVLSALSPAQQVVLVKAAKKDSAALMYALGKNPARLAALAAEKDPINLAVLVSTMAKGVTVKTRQVPAPDRPVRGSAPIAAPQTDKEEERLLKEGQRNGDMTKYLAYQREKRRQAAA